MKKKLVLGVAIGALLMLQSVAAQAISLSFDPVAQSVTNGTQVVVDLTISDLTSGGAPSLGTFDMDLTFDSSVLSLSSVVFGDQLDLSGLGSLTSFDDAVAGMVNLFEMSLESSVDLNGSQLDSFTLATLTFDTVGLGTSSLDLSNVILGDAAGSALLADLTSGSVTVAAAAVPEPSTLLLFGTGLLGLIGYARTRRGQAKRC